MNSDQPPANTDEKLTPPKPFLTKFKEYWEEKRDIRQICFAMSLLFGPAFLGGLLAYWLRDNNNAYIPEEKLQEEAIQYSLDVGIPGRGHSLTLTSLLDNYAFDNSYEEQLVSFARENLYKTRTDGFENNHFISSLLSNAKKLMMNSKHLFCTNDAAHTPQSSGGGHLNLTHFLVSKKQNNVNSNSNQINKNNIFNDGLFEEWSGNFATDVMENPEWKFLSRTFSNDKDPQFPFSKDNLKSYKWHEWALRANYLHRMGQAYSLEKNHIEALSAYKKSEESVINALTYFLQRQKKDESKEDDNNAEAENKTKDVEMEKTTIPDQILPAIYYSNASCFIIDSTLKRVDILRSLGQYSKAFQALNETRSSLNSFETRMNLEAECNNSKAENKNMTTTQTMFNSVYREIGRAAIDSKEAWLFLDQNSFPPTNSFSNTSYKENPECDRDNPECHREYQKFVNLKIRLSKIIDKIEDTPEFKLHKNSSTPLILNLELWKLHSRHGEALALSSIKKGQNDAYKILNEITKNLNSRLNNIYANNSTIDKTTKQQITLISNRLANTLERKGDMYLFNGSLSNNPDFGISEATCNADEAINAYDRSIHLINQFSANRGDTISENQVLKGIYKKRLIAHLISGIPIDIVEPDPSPNLDSSSAAHHYLATLDTILNYYKDDNIQDKDDKKQESKAKNNKKKILLASRVASRLYASDIFNRYGRDERRTLLWAIIKFDLSKSLPNDFTMSP